MGDRFHKAARDGYLEVLKEATRKDLNTKDEDGMTPTLWAAFEGNLDALRLIVGRGGDPDKCDNYGNSALHFSAARGHMPCVSFLVNFGVNMWALDIDFHSAKDLAAINSRDDILRYLDSALGKEEAKDLKKSRASKEKAVKDAEKRAKDFEKLQKKASKNQQEEQLKMAKMRKDMQTEGAGGARPSVAFLSLRKDSRLLYAQSPKFSEIVANQNNATVAATNAGKGAMAHFTGVHKKIQQRKTVAGNKAPSSKDDSDFKIGDGVEMESGKRSVRSLSGLRRDSEILYVPKYDISSGLNNGGKRGKISGLFEDITNQDENDNDGGRRRSSGGGSPPPPPSRATIGKRAGSISGIGLTRSFSQPEHIHQLGKAGGRGSGGSDDGPAPDAVPSIFERPGFGSVAFRNSITSTLATFPNFSQNGNGKDQGKAWDDQNSDDDDVEMGPVELFLAAAGLPKYIPIFVQEKIDLEALMLLTEEDLKEMGIEMGPRRKLLRSIKDRQAAIDDPGEVTDSRL